MNAGNSIHNAEVFCCWKLLALHQGPLLLFVLPYQSGGSRCTGNWEGHRWHGTADPIWPKGYSIPNGVMLSIQKWGKKEWGMFRMMVLIFTKSQLGMRKTCFPRDYWIPACLWESVNHLTIQNTPAVLQFPSSQVITLVDFLTSSLSKKSLIFLHSFLFSAKY